MMLGVDYYPEHWPEERWPTDAKLMKEGRYDELTARARQFLEAIARARAA